MHTGQDITAPAYMENPPLAPSLGLQLTITMQKCHLSTAAMLTRCSHSPQRKTISKSNLPNTYILQKLKLNNKHWEKRQLFTPKSLVNNEQRKFRKIWPTNRPLFYGAIVISTLNALYLSTWTTEPQNVAALFLKQLRVESWIKLSDMIFIIYMKMKKSTWPWNNSFKKERRDYHPALFSNHINHFSR